MVTDSYVGLEWRGAQKIILSGSRSTWTAGLRMLLLPLKPVEYVFPLSICSLTPP